MSKSYQYPVFVSPCFEQRIWGGRRLESEFGFGIPEGNIGECWAVSGYPERESVAENGPCEGRTLSAFWAAEPDFFGAAQLPDEVRESGYPFITKIIDARENLSIQVHPDDAYAAVHENGAKGKTECWYILDCPDDAYLILGHNARTKEEFVQMIEEGQWDALLRRVPVKRGDFVQLEPGTIHAITAGVMLLETQQSSDVTYRVYDYGRLENDKPRQLHIQQSIDVSTVPAPEMDGLVLHTADAAANRTQELVSCKFYRVEKLPVDGNFVMEEKAPFWIASIVEGEGSVTCSGQTYALKKGQSFLLPCDYGKAEFSGKMTVILAAPQGK
ncbi:MAG: class I mannose-6-phosphate isomerase [Eubacteriales bacterium]|nr:class I mannose-6-phosphate isomerase [Eubacteriales bacterium]